MSAKLLFKQVAGITIGVIGAAYIWKKIDYLASTSKKRVYKYEVAPNASGEYQTFKILRLIPK